MRHKSSFGFQLLLATGFSAIGLGWDRGWNEVLFESHKFVGDRVAHVLALFNTMMQRLSLLTPYLVTLLSATSIFLLHYLYAAEDEHQVK
ncbi:uncharacterized protein EI90DRAFT_3045217 [Cantharellus anzutake]|uniref:uncharacterized protein n=1 Tax=Cantharellus anzutake TaxID=1750568 RepID=UPI001904AD20|nr:uncharacterized protein EI90DRAFT_3045217 [Cantharellus anzutake]KAF8336300.1 hypothetical protein EI90DRAFT_3045217 [Cantharellus anzutake]